MNNITTHQLTADTSRFLCNLLKIYRSRSTPESRLASYIIGAEPGIHLRGAFYAAAGLAGCIFLMTCAILIIRAHKGCLWFMRGLKKSNGTYLSPHVGSTFALASLFVALGIELIIIYEVKLWEGKVLPNPILVQTLVWYPLWTGGFCVVWGAAIAALGISQNQRGEGQPARTRLASLIRNPILGNSIMIFIPTVVTVTVFTVFIIANVHSRGLQSSLLKTFEQIGKFPSTTNCTSNGFITDLSSTKLDQILPILMKHNQFSESFTLIMQIGFGFWVIASIINLSIWIPCFVYQIRIFKDQISKEKSKRNQKQKLQLISHPISNPDFYRTYSEPDPHRIRQSHLTGNSDSFNSYSSHRIQSNDSGMKEMSGAYSTLLLNSFLFALMTIAFLTLCTWFVVDPDVVLHGGKRRIYFLASLISFFVVNSMIVNIGVLKQSITAPSNQKKKFKSFKKNKKPSELELGELELGFSFDNLQHSRNLNHNVTITSRGEIFGQAI